MASSTQTLGDRSCFKPTVTLYDWWLVKSEENDETRRLAVAGVASALEEVPRRVFYSAPISKTYDVFTLETTDGVCVILEGLINKEKTVANGFPDEVAKRFQLGFYVGWEKGVAEFLGRDSNTTGVSRRIPDSGSEGKNNYPPTCEHFPQEESTYFCSIFFQSKSLEGNQKDPMCRCSMKHKSTNLIPSSDDVESVEGASGAIVRSRGKMIEPERCSSNSARKVTRFLSEFLSSKWKNQQMAGNGSSSENKTTDSVLKVSETVNNFLQNDNCEVQGKGVESPCPTYVHPPMEEDSHEQVLCENMCNADFPNQLSSKLSLNSSVNDSKFDDLVNHAAEETDKEDFGSTGLQCIGTLNAVEENEKNPVPGCSIRHDSTKVGPLNDEGVVASGVTTLFAEGSTSQFAGRVSQLFSGIVGRKWKKKQMVGNGLNSETNTTYDGCETVGNGMSRPSDFDIQEPMDVNVMRKLDFDFVEDDMQQTSNAEEGHDFGTVTAQVGEGEIGAKEENKFRKRNRRQVTVDTQEIHVTVGVNKRKSTSLSTLEVKKKKDATSVVNKKRKVSPSASELSKKKRLTPSTLEVNSKKVSLSTPKVNTKKRKVSASLEVSKRKPLTRSTQEVNSKKEVYLSTPEVNTKNRKVSPSTLDVRKKNKLRPTLEVNNKAKVSLSMPEVNTKMSIISPESLNARRSRSGRLQLPPLEFWRNQSPIYDKDHGIIGIQEELPKITPSKGSRYEPRKRIARG